MTLPTTPSPPPQPAARPIGRRRLLFAGLLGAVALPLLAACTEPPPPEPDVLEPLLESASADAALAEAVVAAFPELADRVDPVAGDRAAHADALRQEIDRAVTVPPTESSDPEGPGSAEPPADAESALAALQEAIGQAAAQAAELTSSLSGHRAGLVGSISASCTTLGEVLR